MELVNEVVENQDTRTFTDKWFHNVFETLMRIESYERLMKNGCVSLLDYLENKNLNLVIIQEKNYSFLMTEIEILLNNIKAFINADKFLKMSMKIKRIRNIEKLSNGFLSSQTNVVLHTMDNFLKPDFYIIIPLVSELRGLLIASLLSFINPITKKKEKGF